MWTSPRKSLVKGERFIRFEEIPEHTLTSNRLGTQSIGIKAFTDGNPKYIC
jgi:hypothetical protein